MSIQLPLGVDLYLAFVLFLLGACMGSFITCAADRYISHESVLKGRSHCPACGHTLGFFDLIPIFSYLFLRGRCRRCGARIPVRYLFTELLTGLLYAATYLRYGFSAETLESLILFSILLAVALIDYDTMEIPDGLNLAGVVLFAACFWLRGDLLSRAQDGVWGALALGGGMFLISLLMDFVLKRETLGGGDVKLFAMLGLFTGLARGLLMLILSCVVGLLFALTSKNGRRKEFPFGPSIAVAAIACLLVGQEIIDLYLSLIL